MSNVCKCPKPPGGQVSCSHDQLAVCGYRDGEIVSGCFDRPAHVGFVLDKNERNLVVANWVVSMISDTAREEHDPIDSDVLAMLASGQFLNPTTGEVLRFGLPKDLDLESLVDLTPLARA